MESLRRAIEAHGIGQVQMRKLLRCRYTNVKRFLVSPEYMNAQQIYILARKLGMSPEELFRQIVEHRLRRKK